MLLPPESMINLITIKSRTARYPDILYLLETLFPKLNLRLLDNTSKLKKKKKLFLHQFKWHPKEGHRQIKNAVHDTGQLSWFCIVKGAKQEKGGLGEKRSF